MRKRTGPGHIFGRWLAGAGVALILSVSAQPSFAGTAPVSSPNFDSWKPRPCTDCQPTVLLPVPGVRQHTNYSCGEAALLSVLAYYGVDGQQNSLAQQLGTTPDFGTHREDIVRVAKEYGLQPEEAKGMTTADLIAKVKQGIPVIIAMQAWIYEGDPRDLKNWTSEKDAGHYIVAIGYDDKRIYFADPSLFYVGFISFAELDARWHDDDGNEFLEHYGIAISGGGRKPVSKTDYIPID